MLLHKCPAWCLGSRPNVEGLLHILALLTLGSTVAAKAKGAGGFEGVECPEGFELQEDGLCIKPLADTEPLEPPIDLLEAAERGDDVAVAQFLSDGTDPNVRNGRGQTALHLAARHGHDPVCKLLLRNKEVKLDVVDEEGQQPVHLTVPNGHFDTFTLLVKHGADPNAPLKGGSTLLHFASFKGSVEAVEFMLENGSDADTTDRDGARALHAAAYAGNKDVIEALVKKSSASINAQDNTGTTALHLAAQQKQAYVCKALLDLGADPTLQDKSGATPVLVATHTNAGAVLAELLQAMKKRQRARELKQRHGPAQETLLHHAARNGHVDAVKTLLSQKQIIQLIDASTDATSDNGGHTALVLAARAGHYKVCKVLLQAGADPLVSSSAHLDLLTACRLADADPDGQFAVTSLDQWSQTKKPPWPPLWMKLKKLLTQDVIDALEGPVRFQQAQIDNSGPLTEATKDQGYAAMQQELAEADATALRDELERAGLSKGGIDVVLQSPHAQGLGLSVAKARQAQTAVTQSSPGLMGPVLQLNGLKLGDKKRLERFFSEPMAQDSTLGKSPKEEL